MNGAVPLLSVNHLKKSFPIKKGVFARQVGAVRDRALILNLPGQPKAIKETLDGIFPAVPYCIDLIGGPYIETHDSVCKVFRPKSALSRGSAGSP